VLPDGRQTQIQYAEIFLIVLNVLIAVRESLLFGAGFFAYTVHDIQLGAGSPLWGAVVTNH
ncbi:MAG: hypothetical protein LBD91_07705, partial [Prevotellaceae bacterium]|nr:hypothetical protein [Prevotellaceae bacterium]